MLDVVDFIAVESRKHPGDDRPVFIGQAPNRNGDPTKPLTGSVGQKLAALASMTFMEFCLSVVRVNILPYYVERDAFSVKEARVNAIKLAPFLDGRTVVFVGRKVAEAFSFKLPWFVWNEDYFGLAERTIRLKYAAMPHPSGRNRFWNDSQNVQEARVFMSDLMKHESSLPRLRDLRSRAKAIDEARFGRRVPKSVRGEMSGLGADCVSQHHRASDTRGAL